KGNLLDALIADIREQIGLVPLTSDFKLETLPAHHTMNFKIVDEHGRQLEMGRNLAALSSEFGGPARASFQRLAVQPALPAGPPVVAAAPVVAGAGESAEGSLAESPNT